MTTTDQQPTTETAAYQDRNGRIWQPLDLTGRGTAWANDHGGYHETLSELTLTEGPLILIAAFCERCGDPIYDGQPARAWALGLTGQFEHVTCPA